MHNETTIHNVGKKAEEIVKNYFMKQGFSIIPRKKADSGYDFMVNDVYIEVKGSSKNINNITHRFLTDAEHSLFKKNPDKHEIHLVTGIGSKEQRHYILKGHGLNFTKKISWFLPKSNIINKAIEAPKTINSD